MGLFLLRHPSKVPLSLSLVSPRRSHTLQMSGIGKNQVLRLSRLWSYREICKKKTFQPVQAHTPKEESNIELPTIVKQVISDSDTDLSDAYQPSKIAESGSSTSKYATTVEMVSMEIEEDEGTLPVTVPTSHLAEGYQANSKGPAPKLVVQTQHALKGHKMFTKTKVAKTK
ncbi:uncharacterized protein EV154DRAFT_556569 [Mucor mucedo]|uniref:uncharacterized protein n=1 Tax=Mucor mucedo TaxID=29922 RepID=UPI00221F07D5|nr:uncharacterized protein EV154DRAFT_556569 [Mucor mucedo]KAI7871387.1 hypothetical protein EV154DRAFT_556569 [Mucor mucedo]